MTDKALMELIRRLGQLHIEGNIVPPSWYQHLKYPSGKPYHIAITLLSEIVYWFRPRMVRDEHTGEFVGWAKKFKGDGIQRSYAAWGAPFGFTKREAADAVKYLVAEGLITTEIRDIVLTDGTLRPNVVVVTGVDPERLRSITYNNRKSGVVPQDVIPAEGYDISPGEVMPRNGISRPGYHVSTEEVMPQSEGTSIAVAGEGGHSRRTCLESILDIIPETTLDTILPPGGESLSATIALPEETTINHNDSEPTVTPDDIPAAIPVPAARDRMETEVTGMPAYPALLIRPKSRKAVLELGQRPGRDDLAFPAVAAAHLWSARAWQLPVICDPDEQELPVMLVKMEELETALSLLRERALREKQLTFTQVLDDYLRQDEMLRTALLSSPTPLARQVEFLAAVREIIAQWDDAPSPDELHALRSLLGDEAA